MQQSTSFVQATDEPVAKNQQINCREVVGRRSLTCLIALVPAFSQSYLSHRSLKPISQLRFNYDTTTIRRYHDAFNYDESDQNYNMRSIRLRYDYDTTTTKN